MCPWNKFSEQAKEEDFEPRHDLDKAELLDLFNWTEEDFDLRTQGSPIRRIGFERWLRNIAIALGNGPFSDEVVQALKRRRNYSELVAEHVDWALRELEAKS